MTILARFQNHDIEILDVFEGSSGRKLASIRYLDGHEINYWTHGGWCRDDHDQIPVALLHDIRICEHEHTTTRGGRHFSAGEVWDDIEIVCIDCGKSLDAGDLSGPDPEPIDMSKIPF